MVTKLTQEQAIGILNWIRIQCDSQLKKEIDRIVKYIESLAADAAIGKKFKIYREENIEVGQCDGKYSYQQCANKNCGIKTICLGLRAGNGGE